MTKETALKILHDNEYGVNGSFLENIHENCKFDETSYWEYYDCLLTLGKCRDNAEEKEIVKQILHTHNHILSSLAYHFDDRDGYEVKGIPDDYPEYIENLNFAVTAYFTGDYSGEEFFGLQRQ